MTAVVHAVIGRWTTDPARSGEIEHRLRAVARRIASRTGFRAAYWTRDPETGRVHSTVVWDTEDHARGFKADLERHRSPAAVLGLVDDFLIVTAVLASAGP